MEAGISLELIQKYIGHAQMTTTMFFLHATIAWEENASIKMHA